MSEDEEMKVQCFGGDYMGEVFDPMLKRTTYRRQKRWWNAYMLFYTRHDVEEESVMKVMNRLSISKSASNFCSFCLLKNRNNIEICEVLNVRSNSY